MSSLSPVRENRTKDVSISPAKKKSKKQKEKKPFVFKDPGGNVELKYFDKKFSGYMPNSPAVVHVPTTSIISGTGDNERIGNKITIKSFHLQMTFVLDTNQIPVDQLGYADYRFVLVLDTQSNGALPDINDIFDNATDWYICFPNVANSTRFRILKDWKGVLDVKAHNTVEYAWPASRIDYYRKLSIGINYDGPVGDQSQITSNNIYFIGAQNRSNVGMIVEGYTRLRYQDC